MTNNVDVILAMDNASLNLFEVGRRADGRRLDEAREAIANLIDKVDSYVTLGHSDTAYRDISAALARVRGVA